MKKKTKLFLSISAVFVAVTMIGTYAVPPSSGAQAQSAITMTVFSHIDTTATGRAIQVIGNKAYTVSSGGTNDPGYFQIWDITNPSAPSLDGEYLSPDLGDFEIFGNYAIVHKRIEAPASILDISDPTNIQNVFTFPSTGGTACVSGEAVEVFGNYVIMSCGGNGMVLDIWDISSLLMEYVMPTWVSRTWMSPGSVQDIEVLNNIAYVTYTNADKMDAYDISNPAAPFLTGTAAVGRSYEVNVLGNYAYIVGFNSNQLYVVDITDTDSAVTTYPVVGQVAAPGGELSGSYASKLVGNGDYVYATSFSTSSVVVFDTSNKTNPQYYGHDTITSLPFSIDVVGSGGDGSIVYTGLWSGGFDIAEVQLASLPPTPTPTLPTPCLQDILDQTGLTLDDVTSDGQTTDEFNALCSVGNLLFVPSDSTENGSVKLETGQTLFVGSGAVLNGSLQTDVKGTGDNLVVFSDNVTSNGKIKEIGELIIVGGATANIQGGLQDVGTLTLKDGEVGASLYTDGSIVVEFLTMEANSLVSVTGTLECVTPDIDASATVIAGTDLCQ